MTGFTWGKALIISAVITLQGAGQVSASPDFPAVYDVQKVAPQDRLNIRSQPSAKSDILGDLAPDTAGLEVLALSDDGKWGKVGLAEGNGWVAMNFLRAQPKAGGPGLPRPLRCLGTEPFWNLALTQGRAELNTPDHGLVTLSTTQEHTAAQGYFIELAEGPGVTRHVIIDRLACSDGMSDRAYGLSLTMFTQSPQGNSVVRGCCSLDQR